MLVIKTFTFTFNTTTIWTLGETGSNDVGGDSDGGSVHTLGTRGIVRFRVQGLLHWGGVQA
jgi:hypothetical protein